MIPGASVPAPGPAPLPNFDLPLPHGGVLALGRRTLVMGIVNVTPDSFSDGGRHAETDAALEHAAGLVEDGADLLDVGGESTRPGAADIPDAEQVRRVVPLIRELHARFPDVPISVDTRSAEVARAALGAGASIVNDVSAFAHDPGLARVTAEFGAPAVLMHMRGSPANMREQTTYDDVVADVLAELRSRLDAARAEGVEHLIADPGIGFAKTAEQSATLLAATARFADLGAPLLVGPSRKSFLVLATGERDGDPATTRRDATVAAAGIAALLGAHVVRVHDVRACGDAVRLADALRASAEWTSPGETARMTPRSHPI